jgi:4-aminobutyrate aminotransferase-like enzyme
VETQDVTCVDPQPIFWERASGANVWDVDGNRFVDLNAAFGVANTGHAHPRVVAAVQEQAATLLHGMGDVYPSEVKVRLLEALAERFPGAGAARATLVSSGADAVETALKTASLATGRDGIVAFEGAYHGVSLGTLAVTHARRFREPFLGRLPQTTSFARYGDMSDVARAASSCPTDVGAILVEPVLGRGGEVPPPGGFLRELRAFCSERGYLLIADEIYTGFGRTGKLFACEHEAVIPDLLCVGKGLTGGMPLSACVGREEVMRAWPTSRGEALHTQTFLGHPPSCAAALANLCVIEEEGLPERAGWLGEEALSYLRDALGDHPEVKEVRGLGLMQGIVLAQPERCVEACRSALHRGVIVLPSGPHGEVLSITPALNIDREIFFAALDSICEAIS